MKHRTTKHNQLGEGGGCLSEMKHGTTKHNQLGEGFGVY